MTYFDPEIGIGKCPRCGYMISKGENRCGSCGVNLPPPDNDLDELDNRNIMASIHDRDSKGYHKNERDLGSKVCPVCGSQL